MVAEGPLWETAIIKLLPFEQKLSIEAGNQKRDALCCTEAALACRQPRDSHWDTAVDMLMLRQSIKDENEMFCRIKKETLKELETLYFIDIFKKMPQLKGRVGGDATLSANS